MKRIISFLIILSAWVTARSATDSISPRNTFGDWAVEAGVAGSRILPTNNLLKTVDGNEAMIAPDIRAGFSFSRHSRYGRLYPGVRQGIGLTLFNIVPHSSLGRPVGLYLFQTVRIAGNNRLALEGEWNFGVSAGWSKYDPDAPIVNNAIGSKVNAMLGVGLSGVWRISSHWGLKATVNAMHFSNGNTHLPNAGVNTAGLMLGARYYISPVEDVTRLPADKDTFRRGFSYDVTAYGAWRCRVVGDGMGGNVIAPGSFAVAGVNFAAMYDLNRYFRGGLSLDMQYDESANLDRHHADGSYGDHVKFYRQPFADCFAAGLSLRAELTLPIFSINVGLGRNIIANGPDTRIFYQTLALKAHVWRNAFIQVGYQLSEFHLPNNLMFGLGYTFGRLK